MLLCAVLVLSGCVTFSFQKDKTGEFAWQSINWQMGHDVVPLVEFDIDKE